MNMNILALDLGTKTGWAFHDTLHGVEDFSNRRGESAGMRLVRFRTWFAEMILHIKPKIVVYEMPHHRGGAATALLNQMTGLLITACEENGIQYTSVHSLTLKKYATGSGRASKEDMLNKANEKWGALQDDNEADALWILDWARGQYQ